jgi:hypothetical protein
MDGRASCPNVSACASERPPNLKVPRALSLALVALTRAQIVKPPQSLTRLRRRGGRPFTRERVGLAQRLYLTAHTGDVVMSCGVDCQVQ